MLRSLVLGAAAGLFGVAEAENFTYLALGDSLAWGYRSFDEILPGPGDQGYVASVADGLALTNGGIRPTVLNLGVPGDTSTNFFAGGELGALLNTNIPPMLPTGSQNDVFQQVLASNPDLPGGPIEFVTLQLGVNDLLDVVDIDGGFLDLPISAQLDLARAQLPNVESNLATILSDLRSALPQADVRVIGYYDPFAVFLDQPEADPYFGTDGRGAAIAQLSGTLLPELNGLLEQLAMDFDVTFVPTADLFVDAELAFTRIGTIDRDLPNIHPNDAGYALIAERILAVPAPGVGVLLGFGGAIASRRRR